MTSVARRGNEKWVLVPGTLCTSRVFEPLLNAIGVPEDSRHFVSVDAPDVRAYDGRLRNAVTGGEIVCGFSLGALILSHNLDALRSARAIVLLACNPFPDAPDNRAKREAVRDRVIAGEARSWIEENWSVMSSSNDDSLKQTVASMAEEMSHLVAEQTELAMSRPGAEAELKLWNLPLIFVTGSEDKLTPADQLSGIVASAKQAHLRVVEGLGHFGLIEAPELTNQAIQDGLSAAFKNTENEFVRT